ncbi:DUF4232 domain-containing protein [Pilimelia anulata]|uniref:DUF4232 domain-containing protein n=1 Tax=Pilimelia anulata TaxID=53371 RepID=UPI00166BA413|nr:DUF4232 domain-containing protein [Pilimelia anulata]
MTDRRPVTVTVLVGNGSDSRCTLEGRPTVRVGDRPLVVSASDPRGPAVQYPATVDPGEPARVTLTLRDGCAAGRTGGAVAIVEGGREIPVSGLRLDGGCVRAASAWHVEPPLLNLPGLVATIHAPDSAARGEEISFLVTVENTSDRRQDFGGCPAYVAGIGGWSESRKVNCQMTSIEAGSRVDYAMKLVVPTKGVQGKVTLTWTLVAPDGRVVVADLVGGGTPITVV